MQLDISSILVNVLFSISEKYPYYSPAIDRMRWNIVDDNNETMSMSKDLIMTVGKQFFAKVPTDNDREQLVLHELMHYMLNHFARYQKNVHKDEVSYQVHNICMDLEINAYLTANSPYIDSNGMTPKRFGYPSGCSYEEYLNMLINDVESSKENGGNSGNNIIDKLANGKDNSINEITKIDLSNISDEDLTELEQEYENLMETCKKHMESMNGQGIGNEYAKKIEKIQKVKYNWKKVFKNILVTRLTSTEFGFDYQTYSKYNRRLNNASADILFPSKYTYSKELDLLIGVDISGSMYGKTEKMYARIKSIMDNLDFNIHVTIVECDTEVSRVVEDFDFTTPSVNVGIGGGTDMDAILRWLGNEIDNKKRDEPDLIIIMTDNELCWSKKMTRFKKKTYVLTDNVSKSCPYKQFEVVLDE